MGDHPNGDNGGPKITIWLLSGFFKCWCSPSHVWDNLWLRCDWQFLCMPDKLWWEICLEGTHTLRKIWAGGPNSLVDILPTYLCLRLKVIWDDDWYSLECVSVVVPIVDVIVHHILLFSGRGEWIRPPEATVYYYHHPVCSHPDLTNCFRVTKFTWTIQLDGVV